MKNRMNDLNDHLFMMLESLSDDSMSKEDLEMECKRAQAIAKVGSVIVKNYSVAIDAMKLMANGEVEKLPEFATPRIENRKEAIPEKVAELRNTLGKPLSEEDKARLRRY